MIMAVTDGAEILADFEAMKVWGSIIGGLILIDKVLSVLDRLRGKPKTVEVTGEISEASPPATKADLQAVKVDMQTKVEELTAEIDELKDENESQHQAGRLAGEKRVTAIAEVMERETRQIEHAIDGLSAKVDSLTASLREKVVKIEVEVAKQGASIEAIHAVDFRHDKEIATIRDTKGRR